MGDGYGPIVIARRPVTLDEVRDMTIAVPGRLTSASLALRLALGDVRTEIVPFDRILESVADGASEAGLLIHEGQLTYGQSGAHQGLGLGEGGERENRLPPP